MQRTNKKLEKRMLIGYICLAATFGLFSYATMASNVGSNFRSDIEGIQESMLSPAHWKNKLKPEQSSILSDQQISHQNAELFRSNEHMNDLSRYPIRLSRTNVTEIIAKASKVPISHRYYNDGSQVSIKKFKHYRDNLNLKALKDEIQTSFGMVVKRTNLRSFPTSDAVYKTPDDFNLDRFQETALFPTEVVAVLHHSKDQNWFFVISYNYSGWVKQKDIAEGDRKKIFQYKNTGSFLVITGDKVFTTYNPKRSTVSNVQLDMGTKIKLLEEHRIPNNLDGQNTYASHVIELPTRTDEGSLKFELALISRSKDIHIGYLPYTRHNIIEQSFKFLGERYGWGHSYNARDCTGFVGDVYKTFGILMPRNTGQQANSSQGQNIHFSKNASTDDKVKEIKSLDVGDLIYVPGHVMMFLGLQDDKPYVIHDVSGVAYFKEDGSFYKSELNGVSITPLLPLQDNPETSYLDMIYNLKKIR